ncbi:hypothetical protein [Paenibacillus campinasensis]|uniref:Uncharacterized protein n=1 Tax=Paenibacillus campinasensis TaxID=66347 RepID=A0A268EI99_9BACL|nr:hypothetical protein [Paenibacillus campinasensis]PAD72850.1 hypothetical protein CHH67_21320 [Paenibacillus campinasensis]
MLMIGPAIGYIIIGSGLFRFRKQLNLKPEPIAEWIGFAFWWGGWIALLWACFSWLFSFPEPLNWLGLVFAMFWVGVRALKVCSMVSPQ